MLGGLASPLSNLRSYLDTWAQGQSPEYLTVHAQSMIDNILNVLATIPPQDIAVAKEAVAALRRSVAGYRALVDRETKALSGRVEELRATLDANAQASVSSLADLNSNIANAEQRLMKVETSSQDLLTKQQTAFSKAETDRSEAFNDLLTDKRKDLDDALAGMESEVRNTADGITAELEKQKGEAASAKGKIEEILGIVGEEALVAKYSNTADRDRRTADWWRYVTVLSISAAIIFAAWFAWTAKAATTNLTELVAKGLLTLSFGTLATYAARQSSEHRKAQREAEQMALQLAALKPYLQDIDDKPKRDVLLSEIAGKLFVGQRQIEIKDMKLKPSKEDPTVTAQLLAVVLELIKSKS